MTSSTHHARLLTDMALFLAHVHKHRVRVNKSGQITLLSRRALLDRFAAIEEEGPSSVLPGSTDRYLNLLHRLALGAELLAHEDGVIHPFRWCDRWMERSPIDQVGELFSLWKGDENWDELYEVPDFRMASTGLRVNPAKSRSRILDQLTLALNGSSEKISAYRLSQKIKKDEPDLYRPMDDARNWKVEGTRKGQGSGTALKWDELEKQIIRHVLHEVLIWFGALVPTSVRGNGDPSLTVTPLGSHLLKGETAPDEVKCPTITVGANNEILVPRDVRPGTFYAVARFSEERSLGPMTVFRLSRASVQNAIESGISVESIQAFLEANSDNRVPQNLLYSLREWSARFAELSLAEEVVLETSEALLLEELLASKKFSSAFSHRISPTAAAVASGNRTGLAKNLTKAGYHVVSRLPVKRSGSTRPHPYLSLEEHEVRDLYLSLQTLLLIGAELPESRRSTIENQLRLLEQRISDDVKAQLTEQARILVLDR